MSILVNDVFDGTGCSKAVRSSHPQKTPERRSSATPHKAAFEDGGEMAVFQQHAVNNRGFTLIEIMVVVAIIAILAALVGPKIIGRSDDAKIESTKVQIKNFETGLKMYKLDNGVYPGTEQGLQALVVKPTTGAIPKKWKEGGYLESSKVPQDAWGNDFVYLSPGSHGDYDIYSLGADGVKGGEGKNADIESWNLQK